MEQRAKLSAEAAATVVEAADTAHRHQFFHWPLEFPGIFHRARAGFVVVVGNPPWDEVTIEELAFYALRDPGLRGVPLAAESRVPRWRLYDEYPDLLGEFRTRAALQDNTPKAVRDLQDKNAELKRTHIRDRDKLAQSVADVKRPSCIVNVLALENAQLKERLSKPNPRVTPISRQERFRNGGN